MTENENTTDFAPAGTSATDRCAPVVPSRGNRLHTQSRNATQGDLMNNDTTTTPPRYVVDKGSSFIFVRAGDETFGSRENGRPYGRNRSVICPSIVPSGSPIFSDPSWPVSIAINRNGSDRDKIAELIKALLKKNLTLPVADSMMHVTLSRVEKWNVSEYTDTDNSSTMDRTPHPDHFRTRELQVLQIRIQPGLDRNYISQRLEDVADAMENSELPSPSWMPPSGDEWGPDARTAYDHYFMEQAYDHDETQRSQSIAACQRLWVTRPESRDQLVNIFAGIYYGAGYAFSPFHSCLLDLHEVEPHFENLIDLKAQAAAAWALATGLHRVDEELAR